MGARRIKILYCITKANWGGAQKYVYDLATSLPSDKYDVSVLVGAHGTLVDKLQTAGIRTLCLGNLLRDVNLFKDFFSFIKLYKIFLEEKPDIVHLNSSKMGIMGSFVARLVMIRKIIFTGHGWAFNEDRSKLQKKILYILYRLTVFFSHITIAVSEQTKKQVLSKGNNKKVMVIRNGLEQISFFEQKLARDKILEKLPLNMDLQNRFWLGTISELHKNKGLKYMIEALHLLDIATEDKCTLPIFIIIGDGERREKLVERIARYNLQNYVFLVGRIDGAEKYLKAFDLFTLTSITEALPYVILEAGQAGLPIIASGVGGIPEIITDMQNGILVRPMDPVEIKKALDFLLSRPEKRAVFGLNIQAKILTDFSKQKMVNETMEVYNS
jgi:glycosyltransferase involved in cell wall biosynthesis